MIDTRRESAPDPRAVLAALAHDDSRRLYAAIVLELPPPAGISPGRRRRAIEQLHQAGLITRDDSTLGYRASGDPFRGLLASSARSSAPRTGVDRYVTESGRLERIPRHPAERHHLFAALTERLLSRGETLSERDLNERLAAMTDDVPTLRRFLVDYGLIARTSSGDRYWKTVPGPART